MAQEEVAKKKVKVTISSGESEADKGDVVLVHNFKQIVIQRDKEVEIAPEYVEVLKHARVETEVQDEKGKMRQITIPRFSFSVA